MARSSVQVAYMPPIHLRLSPYTDCMPASLVLVLLPCYVDDLGHVVETGVSAAEQPALPALHRARNARRTDFS